MRLPSNVVKINPSTYLQKQRVRQNEISQTLPKRLLLLRQTSTLSTGGIFSVCIESSSEVALSLSGHVEQMFSLHAGSAAQHFNQRVLTFTDGLIQEMRQVTNNPSML